MFRNRSMKNVKTPSVILLHSRIKMSFLFYKTGMYSPLNRLTHWMQLWLLTVLQCSCFTGTTGGQCGPGFGEKMSWPQTTSQLHNMKHETAASPQKCQKAASSVETWNSKRKSSTQDFNRPTKNIWNVMKCSRLKLAKYVKFTKYGRWHISSIGTWALTVHRLMLCYIFYTLKNILLLNGMYISWGTNLI